MTPEPPAYLDYRSGRAAGQRPGRHPATASGAGGRFRAIRPFWQLPDAARIDVRRSLMDPAGGIMVRQMAQPAALTLVLACDVSRSLAADGADRLPGLAALARAAARSALRAGDAFGLLAFDTAIRPELSHAPTRARGPALAAAEALAAFTPDGRGATGILELHARLPQRRCLLILASDFLLPPDVLGAALRSLARHDVAPIVLDPPAPAAMPGIGLRRLRDAETGATRLLLLRPALHRRWQAAEARRAASLDALLAAHARPPLHLAAGIDIARISEHLLA